MKNTVTFVTQIFMGVSVLSIMWLLFGFSLSHGTDNGGFIGGFTNSLFNNVSYTQCYDGTLVSEASYATFMMMFAIICPLLMTGGYVRLPLTHKWRACLDLMQSTGMPNASLFPPFCASLSCGKFLCTTPCLIG